jgi:hypothetical protein
MEYGGCSVDPFDVRNLGDTTCDDLLADIDLLFPYTHCTYRTEVYLSIFRLIMRAMYSLYTRQVIKNGPLGILTN